MFFARRPLTVLAKDSPGVTKSYRTGYHRQEARPWCALAARNYAEVDANELRSVQTMTSNSSERAPRLFLKEVSPLGSASRIHQTYDASLDPPAFAAAQVLDRLFVEN